MADDIKLDDSERQPCEVWTRVMGYFRPVKFFNVGKTGEFSERVLFTEHPEGKGVRRHSTFNSQKECK